MICANVTILNDKEYSDDFCDAIKEWADSHNLKIMGNRCDGGRLCFYDECELWLELHRNTEIEIADYKFRLETEKYDYPK